MQGKNAQDNEEDNMWEIIFGVTNISTLRRKGDSWRVTYNIDKPRVLFHKL